MKSLLTLGILLGCLPATAQAEDVPQTEVFFGDTHLHTSFSPDAYLMGNRSATPDTAYRYAKGPLSDLLQNTMGITPTYSP
ncbi:MAG: DUF3604 domain-containing protein [Planctomycetota bacterium]|jgi:hypothetical protein